MNSIYSIDTSRNIHVYSSKNMIIKRVSDGTTISSPAVMCRDFLSSLCTCINNQAIYYCYINETYELILKNILLKDTLYSVNVCPESFGLVHMYSINSNILILYITKNELSNEFVLCCAKVDINNITSSSTAFLLPINDVSSLDINCVSDMLIFKADGKYYSYIINNSSGPITLNLSKINDSIDNTPDTPSSKNDQYIKDLESELATYKFELESFKEKYEQHKENCEKYQLELNEYKQTIERISTQYDELRSTAKTYKSEAKKWYEKYNKLSQENS